MQGCEIATLVSHIVCNYTLLSHLIISAMSLVGLTTKQGSGEWFVVSQPGKGHTCGLRKISMKQRKTTQQFNECFVLYFMGHKYVSGGLCC